MFDKSLENTLKIYSFESISKIIQNTLLIDDFVLETAYVTSLRMSEGNCQFEAFYQNDHGMFVIEFKLSHGFLLVCNDRGCSFDDLNLLNWQLELPNPDNFTPPITSVIELLVRSEIKIFKKHIMLDEAEKMELNQELTVLMGG